MIAQLAPFRAAEPAPRRSRARATPTPGSAADSDAASGSSGTTGDAEASDAERREAKGGDTLQSTPHRAKKKEPAAAASVDKSGLAKGESPRAPARLDTIQLVERAGEGRDLATGTAVLLILGLSVFAGVATYMVRAHGKGTSDVPTATASAAQVPAP